MTARICQKCFDGFVGACACSKPQRVWEPPRTLAEDNRFKEPKAQKPTRNL